MILDTNALSAFADGEASLARALAGVPQLALPVIVLGEFLYGIAASRHRAAYGQWRETQLPFFDVLPITAATTEAYADVRTALKRSGKPIRANDAWIAAIALQHRLAVVSRDEHFDVGPGLQRRSW